MRFSLPSLIVVVTALLLSFPATAEKPARKSLGETKPSSGMMKKATPALKPAAVAEKGNKPAINIPTPKGWKCIVKGRIEANIWSDFVGEAPTANEAQQKAYAACQAMNASCGTAQCTATY